jgi:hypothetical protein
MWLNIQLNSDQPRLSAEPNGIGIQADNQQAP